MSDIISSRPGIIKDPCWSFCYQLLMDSDDSFFSFLEEQFWKVMHRVTPYMCFNRSDWHLLSSVLFKETRDVKRYRVRRKISWVPWSIALKKKKKKGRRREKTIHRNLEFIWWSVTYVLLWVIPQVYVLVIIILFFVGFFYF